MELGEDAREGAVREVWEEAFAEVEVGPLLAVYNVPGQVRCSVELEVLSCFIHLTLSSSGRFKFCIWLL